jgi:iron only hydrogenase large subunit-like protein
LVVESTVCPAWICLVSNAQSLLIVSVAPSQG